MMIPARVNNKLVPRAPRGGPSCLHYNPAIDRLFNQLPGELGLKAQSFDGAGGGLPSDTSRAYERLDRAIPSVQAFRTLTRILSRMPTGQQIQLRQRYRVSEREHTQIPGLEAAFGDLRCLAWHLCEDKETMRVTLSSAKKKRDNSVEALRRLTERVNREIHIAWLDAERLVAREWAEGER